MDADRPSTTAVGVALTRAGFDRPATPTGDPDADVALARSLAEGGDDGGGLFAPERRRAPGAGEGGFAHFLARRTAFFDDAVLDALAAGVGQVVVLGAGYDGRSLRFRHPGTTFFEVDHPATQADKRARLARLGIAADGVVFVPADFTEPGLPAALAAAGFVAAEPALLLLEGVLRYLPERWFRGLLADVATVAAGAAPAPGSGLAVSIATTRPGEPPERAADRLAHEQRMAEAGEAVHTVPEAAVALRWLDEAGWEVESVRDLADEADGWHPGFLLVRARPHR